MWSIKALALCSEVSLRQNDRLDRKKYAPTPMFELGGIIIFASNVAHGLDLISPYLNFVMYKILMKSILNSKCIQNNSEQTIIHFD